jgi:DNA-binding GntR family transcriptional regulator
VPTEHKEPLKDKIIEHIYSAIINEEYTHGSQVKELHLSEKLKVSRAPVREALLELVSLGVLEQVARKGVFVKEITSKDIYDTYESKGVIEGFLATEFALNATTKDIELLSLHVEQMSNTKNDRKKVVKIGEEFHKLTLKYAKLYSQKEVKQRHHKIVEAIKTRDKKVIEDVIREHYFETGTKIILLREVK